MAVGIILVAITLAVVVIVSCEANFLGDWFQHSFAEKNDKRSLPDVIGQLLDLFYPKDDKESRIMKQIFMMFSNEGFPSIQDHISGLEYVLES